MMCFYGKDLDSYGHVVFVSNISLYHLPDVQVTYLNIPFTAIYFLLVALVNVTIQCT